MKQLYQEWHDNLASRKNCCTRFVETEHPILETKYGYSFSLTGFIPIPMLDIELEKGKHLTKKETGANDYSTK